MATTRFDMRVDEKIKAKAEKASALLGMKSLSEYVTMLMDEDASRVIAQHENMTVKNDVFDDFMSACEKAGRPNKALQDAADFTKKQDIK